MNSKISYADSIFSTPKEEIEVDAIFQIIASDKLSSLTNEIRQSNSKEKRTTLKKELPVVTLSGTFRDSFQAENCVEHSGYLQIDLDDITEPNTVIETLKIDPYIYATWISPSGNGVKAIVKIPASKDNHFKAFNLVEKYFNEKYKMTIDPSCKNVNRFLFLSHDPNIFVKPESKIFEIVHDPILYPIPETRSDTDRTHSMKHSRNGSETLERTIQLIQNIEKNHIDITSGYSDNWLKIGFAFANEYGENGRELFQRVSKFHPEYSVDVCDKQFDKCLNANGSNKIGIGTFFHIAKSYAVDTTSLPQTKKRGVTIFDIAEEYLNEKYEFRYNIITNVIECKEKNKEDEKFLELNENNLFIELQKAGIKMSLNNLKALLKSDFAPEFDPISSYFNKLTEWDGITDYIDQLANYVSAIDQKRFNIQFKKMLVRSIACSLNAETVNKQCFILVHDKQNSGKTTFLRFLTPPELSNYYTENLTLDKDGNISLCENFIINLDEMATLQKKEITSLKSILSKQFDKSRRPFDTRPINRRRTANFIGSTNSIEFLSDETGSVRWLCFEISNINWKYSSEVDIDKVWAQAYALYKSGFKYELSKEEIYENEEINRRHTIMTPEMELISKYFKPALKEDSQVFYTATDLMRALQEITNNNIRLNHINIGKALKSLGFIQDQKYNGTYQVKGYYLNHADNQPQN